MKVRHWIVGRRENYKPWPLLLWQSALLTRVPRLAGSATGSPRDDLSQPLAQEELHGREQFLLAFSCFTSSIPLPLTVIEQSIQGFYQPVRFFYSFCETFPSLHERVADFPCCYSHVHGNIHTHTSHVHILKDLSFHIGLRAFIPKCGNDWYVNKLLAFDNCKGRSSFL